MALCKDHITTMHILKEQDAFIDKFKTFMPLGPERMKCTLQVTGSHAYINRPGLERITHAKSKWLSRLFLYCVSLRNRNYVSIFSV